MGIVEYVVIIVLRPCLQFDLTHHKEFGMFCENIVALVDSLHDLGPLPSNLCLIAATGFGKTIVFTGYHTLLKSEAGAFNDHC